MRPPHRRLAAALVVALVAATSVVAGPAPVASAPGTEQLAAVAAPGDGTTAASAGASCWGIKQQHPTSPTGTYWLWTASLDRPGAYHCDMDTDGGGWVLVGRGRNGWTFNPGGQGSATAVRTAVDGPAAFVPAALDTATVNGLLDGADLAANVDGIRLERSLTPDGTTRQDLRMLPTWHTWKWSFDVGQLLASVRIDGTTYLGSNTRDTSASSAGQVVNELIGRNDQRRLYTADLSTHDGQQGFGLGATVVGGSNAATNHLWTVGVEGSPLPFTRVWLRPRIATPSAGYTPIPVGGFAAASKPAALEQRSELAPWGVVGYDHTGEASAEPWNTTVLSITAYGDRVYVGGRFTHVQQGPGGTPVAQPFLAAFDLDGNWISTFRPVLDGRVWDLVVTADGKLIVGGDFTNVGGAPDTSGLAALDLQTGAVISTWRGSVARVGSSERPIVRALETRGPWVYAAGRFNRVTGGTATDVTVPSSVNLSTATGQPGDWRPQLNASALDIQVSADGSRVYLAGYFNAVNGNTDHGYHAVTKAADGTPVAGIGPLQPSTGSGDKVYQQAVGEVDGKLLVGGSQHSLQEYDATRTALLDSHITRSGGDFQAIEVYGGYVYASCHCMNFTYSGTNNFASPSGFRAVDAIRTIARWNAQTFDYDPSWWPNGLKGNNDEGAWGITQDVRGCLWIGGDYTRGAYSGDAATDWLGGIARFCPEDTSPPTAPTGLTATPGAARVDLSWGASADTGAVAYDVYRNDRIIATVAGTTYRDAIDLAAAGPQRYTVRAADARGNRSASPAPVSVADPARLRATTSPALPADVVVDGIARDSWGLNWVALPAGAHQVCFGPVPGYAAPPCQTATLASGTTTVTGTYTANGYLRATTSPAVASTITVDGVARNDWGLWAEVPPGTYQVCFGAVAGFATPSCRAVAVTPGATATTTGTFTTQPGAPGPAPGFGYLRATTSPALGAMISIDGQWANNWGVDWVKLPAGTHQVCFGPAPAATAPACSSVSVTAGGTTTLTGTYAAKGFLRVVTSPALPATVTVDAQVANAYGIWTPKAPGTYQVCFGALAGYAAPACQSATVTAGATTTITGTYAPS